jgi:hypothetical protein
LALLSGRHSAARGQVRRAARRGGWHDEAGKATRWAAQRSRRLSAADSALRRTARCNECCGLAGDTAGRMTHGQRGVVGGAARRAAQCGGWRGAEELRGMAGGAEGLAAPRAAWRGGRCGTVDGTARQASGVAGSAARRRHGERAAWAASHPSSPHQPVPILSVRDTWGRDGSREWGARGADLTRRSKTRGGSAPTRRRDTSRADSAKDCSFLLFLFFRDASEQGPRELERHRSGGATTCGREWHVV